MLRAAVWPNDASKGHGPRIFSLSVWYALRIKGEAAGAMGTVGALGA